MTQPLRIFIGTEPSQVVAHRVLEHSIRTHATVPVEITTMLGLPLPVPVDPANRSKVGFSFTRFLIPDLCRRTGRAVYLDSDMLVFGDVAELAALPFGSARVLCTYQPEPPAAWKDKPSFRPGRHTAVLVLDCARLDWDAEKIVHGLDEGRYTYEELVHELCIVDHVDVAPTIPRPWNHLERYEPGVTRLLHYTVVFTQPWKTDKNPLAGVWMQAYAEAVEAGAVPPEEVEEGVAAGHLKPSLLGFLHLAPGRRSATDDARAARDLALARLEIARLEQTIDRLHGSRAWKVGTSITGALGATRRLAGRVGRRRAPSR